MTVLDEVKDSQEGALYVRGGMHPAFSSPDAVVKQLSRSGKIRSATAFLEGWVNHRPVDPAHNVPLHRTARWGNTQIEVTSA